MKTKLIAIGASVIFAILSLLCIRISMSIHEQNSRTARGVLYEKFICPRKYTQCVMVIKENNGNYFDVCVTPSCYATHEVGDSITIPEVRLSKLGEEEKGGEIFWFIIAVVLAFIIIMVAISIKEI